MDVEEPDDKTLDDDPNQLQTENLTVIPNRKILPSFEVSPSEHTDDGLDVVVFSVPVVEAGLCVEGFITLFEFEECGRWSFVTGLSVGDLSRS